MRGSSLKDFAFSIYDRWGIKVFETDNQLKGWDGKFNGKELNTGVYAYLFLATEEDKPIILKGIISLMK